MTASGDCFTSSRTLPRSGLFAAPLAVLGASLCIVLWHLGPGALYRPIAHESEARSLPMVILFPGHALREWPHVILLALCWLQGLRPPRDGRGAVRQLAGAGTVALCYGLLIFLWSWAEEGFRPAWLDAAQFRAAPDLTGLGVHFRFHILSDVALSALFFSSGRLLSSSTEARGGFPWTLGFAVACFVLTMRVWGVEEVTTPRFIGHQAREIFTHTVVTLPLLMACVPRRRAPAPGRAWRRWEMWAGAALACGIGGYLLHGVLSVDILSHSSNPGRPLALNLAVHNFEHLLDLLLLLSVTAIRPWEQRA